MGHAVRMRALARALAAQGVDVVFQTSTPMLASFVTPFSCIDLPGYFPSNIDVLIIDTKAYISEAWFYEWRSLRQCKVVRIDHPHAEPGTCDLLVAPVAHWHHAVVQRLLEGFGERFLYGWDYVMLNEEVTRRDPIPYEMREDNIILCAGGSDPDNILQKMWDWTVEADILPGIPLGFCYGKYVPPERQPKKSTVPHRYVVPFETRGLAHAKMTVGLFGVTPYECLWYKTPMLMMAHTEENCEGAWNLALASNWACRWLGPIQAMNAKHFKMTLESFWFESYRVEMNRATHNLLDGRGIERIADAILAL